MRVFAARGRDVGATQTLSVESEKMFGPGPTLLPAELLTVHV